MVRRVLLVVGLAWSGLAVAQTGPATPPVGKTVIEEPPPLPPPSPPKQDPRTKVLAPPTKDETCAPRTRPFKFEAHAGRGSDRAWAGDDDARIFGDGDSDMLAGGPADDEVHGGTEGDILVGGAGSDRFVFDTTDDSPTDEQGQWSPLSGDTVVDFTGSDFDKFDLRPLPRTGDGAPDSFRWGARRAVPYGVWTQPRSGDTVVFIDTDGDAAPELAVRLIGTISLRATDFCGAEVRH